MKLSIITINYNNCIGLQKTIESVISQTWRDFEWIVIDGASTDGSKELIEKYQEYFAYWCSEPDTGVYNAMNKGIYKAKGEYLLFLNSGDCLHNSTVLERVSKIEIKADILYGNINLVSPNERKIYNYPENLTLHYFLNCSIGHPASFIKASLFKGNAYREDFKIVSDWLNFIKWFRQKKIFYYIPFTIADFEITGISSTNKELLNQEKKIVYDEVFGKENYQWIVESITLYQQYERYNNKDFETLMNIRSHGGIRMQLVRFLMNILAKTL